jgi:hypothetical protein
MTPTVKKFWHHASLSRNGGTHPDDHRLCITDDGHRTTTTAATSLISSALDLPSCASLKSHRKHERVRIPSSPHRQKILASGALTGAPGRRSPWHAWVSGVRHVGARVTGSSDGGAGEPSRIMDYAWQHGDMNRSPTTWHESHAPHAGPCQLHTERVP